GKNGVCLRRGRSVGSLGENSAIDLGGVLGGYDSFQGCRHENREPYFEQFVVRKTFGSRKVTQEFAGGHVLIQASEINPLWIADGTIAITQANYAHTAAGQLLANHGTDVSVALHDRRRFPR